MCSISGIVIRGHDEGLVCRLERMVRQQTHRGPDDAGTWLGRLGQMQCGLGNTRLAILDLSEAGHQPFVSEDTQHVLVYNGEVYNYLETRAELKALGHRFRTDCDTEVVLHALMQWGEQALQKFNGMWGLAWLDRSAGRLLLARDRFGTKPLYYFADANSLVFASEIKAILTDSGRPFRINTTIVLRFLEQSLRDAQPETFFDGINALPAGHLARVDLYAESPRLDVQPYWDLPHQAIQIDPGEAVHTVRSLFLDAIRLRLRSDVPVGVLLSGGLDSASIAAAMHHTLGAGADLHLISAVNDDPRYDEEPFIDVMANYLGCRSHKVRILSRPNDLLDLRATATYFNDEPLGGLSTLAHYQLMRRAQELGVTVLLTGQGADELLCGYLKYVGFYTQSLLRGRRPDAAIRLLVDFARQGTVLQQVRFRDAKRYLPSALRWGRIDIRGPRLKGQNALVSLGLGDEGVLARQHADMYRLSLPSILHTEDRMSMAASREMRVPFLDYRLASFLSSLPPALKLRDGWTKWVMRKAMEPYLPATTTWRKDKRHFSTPQDVWLKNELRSQIEEFFAGDLLTAQAGLVDQRALQSTYAAFCRQSMTSGTIPSEAIFNPLALEIWMRQFRAHLAAPTDLAVDEPLLASTVG
jgi:asparagine synthase (glutamine-hydrolysing)